MLREGARLSIRSVAARGTYFEVHGAGQSGWIHYSFVRTASARMGTEGDAQEDGAAHEAGRDLALGLPQLRFERERTAYTVSVDSRLGIPLWVQYELSSSDLDGPGDRELSSFRSDTTLPELARARLSDYRNSGFDRGHMAPAGDMKRSQAVMDESFLLSNVAPQVGLGFNRGIWRFLEEAVRDWVGVRGELTVIVGPVFEVDQDAIVTYEVIGESRVAVPTAFFKVVVDEDADDGVEALAFLIPNQALFGEDFEEYLVSIDEIEAITGADLLSSLPDDEEEELESHSAASVWPTGGRLAELTGESRSERTLLPLELTADGRVRNPGELSAVLRQVAELRPTHVYLLAHGWNNSRSEAESSYRLLLELLSEAHRPTAPRPDPYRPICIGIYWPSKAWSSGTGRIYSPRAGEDLTFAIAKSLPGDVPVRDVLRLRELLRRSTALDDPRDVRETIEILARYSAPPVGEQERSVFDTGVGGRNDAAAQRLSRLSVRDVFRVFTFWQMKKRAGVVGRRGVRDLVERLFTRAPEAEFHFGGHSFGCKVLLAAFGERDWVPTRNLDSLILLQGALSSWAFAERVHGTNSPGAYRSILPRVSGPIVATYSARDWALRVAYPLGARLAGQVGELERMSRSSRYSALGGEGAFGVAAQGAEIGAVGHRYELAPGLWSIRGDHVITGHSDYFNERVAWLIWSAIRSASTR